MSPRSATSNLIDRRSGDAIFCCEDFPISFVSKDFANRGGRQHHISWSLSLYPHVARIIGAGSKEKMIRVDTGGNITGVTNTHPFGNGSISILETGSMGVDISVSNAGKAVSSDRLVFRAKPNPATVRVAINLRPKSFREHGINSDAAWDHSQVNEEGA